MDALSVSHGLLWIVILALGVALLALTRQVGLLHERLPAVGALVSDQGPAVGESAPRMTVTDLAGSPFELGAPSSNGRRTLLFFVSDTCPICKQILPWLESFARGEELDLVLVGDGVRRGQERLIRRFGLEASRFVNSSEVGMAFQVGKLPHAVLIDERGTLLAKGLVNSREHLESLVVSAETGYGSIQEFLGARQGASDAS